MLFRSDAGLSLDHYTGVYHRISANLDVRVDVGRGRIDNGHAGRHQLFVLLLSHEGAHFRQFSAAVDAADFLRVVDLQGFDRQLAFTVNRHEIGQVVLALGIIGGDAAQGLEQRRQVEGVDPRVDLVEELLLRRGLAILDDGRDPLLGLDESIAQIGTMLEQMDTILKEMQRLETFQEAIELLKSIIDQQQQLEDRTKSERKKRRIQELKGLSDETEK